MFSIDYLFNRIYDVLLWIKYFWYFKILRYSEEKYLASVEGYEWEGLRDRGWIKISQNQVEEIDSNKLDFLKNFGIDTKKDTDGDGIPNVKDPSTFDENNLTKENIKEIYGEDLAWTDHIRMFFGFSPRDFDQDGVPDSVEKKKGLDPNSVDTDKDGLLDGSELWRGINPLLSDSDNDGVLDGRDFYPLDYFRSFTQDDVDEDGDRLGNVQEFSLGTNPKLADTDGDGFWDGIDPYPLDSSLYGQGISGKIYSALERNPLSFSIQNSFLGFLVDILSILYLFLIPTFLIIFLLWFLQIKHSIEHYYHLFEDAIGYKGVFDKHKKHKIHNNTHLNANNDSAYREKQIINTHIDNKTHKIVVNENIIISKPKEEEYKKHPRWAIIEDYMSSHHETLWRIGIIEADNLLFDVLKALDYPGESVGEMLKNANFRSIDLAWEAHKVRNRIAHEGMKFHLTERHAKKTFACYEAVFRELKII